jgi:hypothetical protein
MPRLGYGGAAGTLSSHHANYGLIFVCPIHSWPILISAGLGPRVASPKLPLPSCPGTRDGDCLLGLDEATALGCFHLQWKQWIRICWIKKLPAPARRAWGKAVYTNQAVTRQTRLQLMPATPIRIGPHPIRIGSHPIRIGNNAILCPLYTILQWVWFSDVELLRIT